MKQVKHWTYSRLSDYEKCPRLYAARSLKIYPTFAPTEHPAMARGTAIHTVMENAWLKGAKLPGALARYAPLLDQLRKDWPTTHVEMAVALNNQWKPAAYDAPTMWVRSKIDWLGFAGHEARVIDWKTGRIYGTNADQVRLYAGFVFQTYKMIKTVHVELVYLDQKAGIEESIAREQWVEKRKEFTARANTMLAATEFPPKPSAYCGVCSYSAAKGGPCKEGIRDRTGLQTDSAKTILLADQIAPLRRRHARPDFADAGPAVGAGGIQTPRRKAKSDPKGKA